MPWYKKLPMLDKNVVSTIEIAIYVKQQGQLL
jgi:hypothetical protein